MALRPPRAERPLPGRLNWRPMTAADLDAVAAIALIAFPDHFEDRDCFENRLALHPGGCFVLVGEKGVPRGYCVAYPWVADAAPALNMRIEALPEDPAVLYLHDLALHPDARGGGHSRAIMARLVDQARALGLPAIALVAVNAAEGFWRGHGFLPHSTPALIDKLAAAYGADARYMVRRV